MGLTDEQCESLQNKARTDLGIVTYGGRNTFLATYRGGIRTYDNQAYRTFSLSGALEAATEPGDTIQVLGGKYWPKFCGDPQSRHRPVYNPFVIKDYHGRAGCPITIRGETTPGLAKPILCGSNAATPKYPDLPERSDFAFFQIIDSEWITIEGFQVESCWPCFVYIENSQNITVRDISAIDSVYLIFARGQSCSEILVENCEWRQDPSGALRDELYWADMHGHEGTPWNYAFYNGGLFGSANIRGNIIIRENKVEDAYNGIRMRGDRQKPRQQNINVQIYDNRFINVRDNAIEPEGTAYNWYIHGNRFCNVHNPFSLEKLSGGHWYIFGNISWFTQRNGQITDEHTAGKPIFKFNTEGPFPQWPVFVFNNSWYTRSKIIKKGLIRNMTHVSNAIQVCNPDEYEDCICTQVVNIFDKKFPGLDPSHNNHFDYDLTNASLATLTNHGYETHGRADPEFHFRDPPNGDLILAPSWSNEDAAPLVVKAGDDWLGQHDWEFATHNPARNIGAYQGEELVIGPPFVKYETKK